jgi:hypothetical protein
MRRVLVLLGVLVAGVTAGAATMQLVPDFREGYEDTELAASPCGASATVQASPFVFEQHVWMTYLCGDTRVIARRFRTLTQVEEAAGPVPLVCPAGFVLTWDNQGCVTPDHPAAGKK